jgi:hypothetical protein
VRRIRVTISYPDDAFVAEMTQPPSRLGSVDQHVSEKGYDGQGIFDSAMGYIDHFNSVYK